MKSNKKANNVLYKCYRFIMQQRNKGTCAYIILKRKKYIRSIQPFASKPSHKHNHQFCKYTNKHSKNLHCHTKIEG